MEDTRRSSLVCLSLRGESDDLTAVGHSRAEPNHVCCSGCWAYHERVWRGSTLQQRGACQAVSSSVVSNDPWLSPGEGEGSLRC